MITAMTLDSPIDLSKNFERAAYVSHYKNTLCKNTMSSQYEIIESTITCTNNTISEAKSNSLFTNVIEELERYQKFTIGWDGYRGVPFDKSTVDKANKIVYLTQNLFKTHFIHPDDITPGPASDGTIDIEIEYNKKNINFLIDSELQKIMCSNSESETDEIIQFDDEMSLVKQLTWLIS